MNTLTDIRRAALNLLARREHSEAELFRKLQHKSFDPTDIYTVIHTLIAEGLLNNTRFLENFLHARRNKGYGPLRIRAELIERGIAEDLIEQCLNITDNAWLDEIRNVWRKRFKNQLPRDFKTRAQQMRFLHYRGFTAEQIESMFNDVS